LGSQGGGFTYYRSGGNLCFYGGWEYMNGTEKDYTFTADGNALLDLRGWFPCEPRS
jgi:hypothetical protein